MTAYIHLHQKPKAASFTQLPNFLFEAPGFQPLSNGAKILYAKLLRRTDLSRKNGWADECGNCNTPGWWRSGSRALENPTAFTQNPMRRFQTPTSRNPAVVRRRAENRTHGVRFSALRSTETGRYIER